MNFWVFPNVELESTDDLSDNFTKERPLSSFDKSIWYEDFLKTVLVRDREGRTRFWLADTRFRNTSESDSGTGVSRTSETDSCLEQTLNTRVRSSLVSAVWSRKFSCARIPCSKCPWRIPFGLQTATDPVYEGFCNLNFGSKYDKYSKNKIINIRSHVKISFFISRSHVPK